MPDFNELIPLVLQMLPHALALVGGRSAPRASRRRSGHRDGRLVGGASLPAPAGSSAFLELVRGLPAGAALRYEAPDGTVLTCWTAPGAEPGEYRLW
ncbi:hypothetical protein [Streptomyces sp. NPDC059783]|uniref:hypothetical protein n=1 Tax=Streptomyces sp. NPDC059783 TaxID=3346944 RepID=UPI003669A895